MAVEPGGLGEGGRAGGVCGGDEGGGEKDLQSILFLKQTCYTSLMNGKGDTP